MLSRLCINSVIIALKILCTEASVEVMLNKYWWNSSHNFEMECTAWIQSTLQHILPYLIYSCVFIRTVTVNY
jgi:hypothetical protein